MTRFLFLGLFTSLLSFTTWAQVWVINKDHSEILFQVEYLGISEVNGRFKVFSGSVNFDEKQMPFDMAIKVNTASIDTGNNLRDGHLRANDFLQSKEHPHIVFQSNRVKHLKANLYKAEGQLTIKGNSKPFAINFSLSDSIKDTWGYQNRFVKFTSKINRKDFNIKWNKTLAEQKYLVGDEVDFWGTFQLQPSALKTPGTKHMIPDTSYTRSREMEARGEIVRSEPEESIGETAVVAQRPVAINKISPITPVPGAGDFRDNNLWWISLWSLGLLGFFAVIIVCFYSKNILAEYFPRNYEENGLLGYLSDLVVIALVIIYSFAFWFVGWGVR